MQFAAAAYDPVVLLAVVLFAMTGGDLVQLTATVLGSSGLAGIIIAMVGLRRARAEMHVQLDAQAHQREEERIAASAAVRTVAAEEAESAMRVMGQTVDRVAEELRDERTKRIALADELAVCQRTCADCLAQVRRLKGAR